MLAHDAVLPVAWYAAIDYARFTHESCSDMGKVGAAYHAMVSRITREMYGSQERLEPWRWLGYQGWGSAGIKWGEGPAGLVLQASGTAAALAWDAEPTFTNVPRIDLQVTAWYADEDAFRARFAEHETTNARLHARGRPWKVRYIDGHGDGDTLYVGVRGKKSKFLRVYDKYRESGRLHEFEYAWRYEAELTDVHAREAVGQLLDGGTSTSAVFALVQSYFAERGITLPPVVAAAPIDRGSLPKDETSIDRRLRWLSAQVAPAIEKMIGQGATLEQVLEALHLDRRAGVR